MTIKNFSNTLILIILSFSLLGGCSSRKIVEYENGEVVRVTETEDTVVGSITNSTKNKSIFNWTALFGFDLELIVLPVKEMSPRVHLRFGKITNGTMSILSGQLNLNEIPSIINAASDTQLETKETEPK